MHFKGIHAIITVNVIINEQIQRFCDKNRKNLDIKYHKLLVCNNP